MCTPDAEGVGQLCEYTESAVNKVRKNNKTFFIINSIRWVYINMLKYVLATLTLFFNNLLFSQIKIDDVGDNWKLKVETSLLLIKQYDKPKYDSLMKYCNHITFWNGRYSTIEDSKTIMLSQLDMNTDYLYNVCCAIVHESYHLKYYNQPNDKNCEEYLAYQYEIEFIKRLEQPLPWLHEHALRMSSFFEEKCK